MTWAGKQKDTGNVEKRKLVINRTNMEMPKRKHNSSGSHIFLGNLYDWVPLWSVCNQQMHRAWRVRGNHWIHGCIHSFIHSFNTTDGWGAKIEILLATIRITWQHDHMLQLVWSGRRIRWGLLQTTGRNLMFTGIGLDSLQRTSPTSTFLWLRDSTKTRIYY